MPNENQPEGVPVCSPVESYTPQTLAAHLKARHGWNDDTVSIWNATERADQHDRYHADPSAEDHWHREKRVEEPRAVLVWHGDLVWLCKELAHLTGAGCPDRLRHIATEHGIEL